jgi:hypothetical protein
MPLIFRNASTSYGGSLFVEMSVNHGFLRTDPLTRSGTARGPAAFPRSRGDIANREQVAMSWEAVRATSARPQRSILGTLWLWPALPPWLMPQAPAALGGARR